MPDTTVASLLPEDQPVAAASRRLPGHGAHQDKDEAAIRQRRDAFERAEASLSLEGMKPYGDPYERLRDAVIAGHMTAEAAVAEISASFGPDVE